MTVKNRIHPERRKGIEKNVPLQLHIFFNQKRVCLFYTGFRCDLAQWDADKQGMKNNTQNKLGQSYSYVNIHLKAIRAAVDTWAKENPNGTKEELLKVLRKAADKKEKIVPLEVGTIFSLYDLSISEKKICDDRRCHYEGFKGTLLRYEEYVKKPLTFDIDLHSFEEYLKIEHTIHTKRRQKGKNAVIESMSYLRTFYIWLLKKKHISYNPFSDYKLDATKYGTPFFITIEERNHLYNFDFKDRSDLAITRDIFVFQCLVGCRYGDLRTFLPTNVIDGFLEYIADKTSGENPKKIRVPLSATALEIVNRYSGGTMLLPCLTILMHIRKVKELFTIAELTRMVTVLDPITHTDIQKPLNKIAASHLSRRTLIGNLYSKVQDPSIISSISGHVDGSKAFARYRTIDDKIKTDIINLIQ